MSRPTFNYSYYQKMWFERILHEDVTPIAQSSGQSMVDTNMDENYFYRSTHGQVGAHFSQFIGLYFQWLLFSPDFFEFTLCHSVQTTWACFMTVSRESNPSQERTPCFNIASQTAHPVRVLYGEICLDVITYRFTVSVADWWHDSWVLSLQASHRMLRRRDYGNSQT